MIRYCRLLPRSMFCLKPSMRFYCEPAKPLNSDLTTIAGFYNQLVGKKGNPEHNQNNQKKKKKKKKKNRNGPHNVVQQTSNHENRVLKTDTAKPEIATTEPTEAAAKPEISTTEPTEAAAKPETSTTQPTEAASKPTNGQMTKTPYPHNRHQAVQSTYKPPHSKTPAEQKPQEAHSKLIERVRHLEEKNRLLMSGTSPMAGLPLPTALQYEVLMAEAKEYNWESKTGEKPSDEVEYFGSINSVNLVGVCGSPTAKALQTGMCAVVPLTTTFTRSEINGAGTLTERERHQIHLHGTTLTNFAMKYIREGFLLHVQGRLSGYMSFDETQAQHIQRFGIHVHPEQGGSVTIVRGSSNPRSDIYSSVSHGVSVSKSRAVAIENEKQKRLKENPGLRYHHKRENIHNNQGKNQSKSSNSKRY